MDKHRLKRLAKERALNVSQKRMTIHRRGGSYTPETSQHSQGSSDMTATALWKLAYAPDSVFDIYFHGPAKLGRIPIYLCRPTWTDPVTGVSYSIHFEATSIPLLIDELFRGQDAAYPRVDKRNQGLELIDSRDLLLPLMSGIRTSPDYREAIIDNVKHPRAVDILKADYEAWEKAGSPGAAPKKPTNVTSVADMPEELRRQHGINADGSSMTPEQMAEYDAKKAAAVVSVPAESATTGAVTP